MSDLVIQQLLNGLNLGVMYSLMAVGFTLFFGVINLVNFAHGDIFMLGAFVALATATALANAGLGLSLPALFAIVFLVTLLLGAVIGAVVERLVCLPMRSAPDIMTLLITVGAGIVIREAVMLFYPNGRNPQSFPVLTDFQSVTIGGVLIKPDVLITILAAVVLITALHLIINKTSFGRFVRATAQDKEAALMMGINIDKVFLATFALGSALGAVAGLMNGMAYGIIKFNMGFTMGIKGFSAAVVGGLGNIYGAVAGGLLLGFLEMMVSAFIPDGSRFQDIISFVIVILFLVFKPSGIFGEKTYEKV